MTEDKKLLAVQLMLASKMAEIEGYKVANAERVQAGMAPAYGEKVFFDISNELLSLANNLVEGGAVV